jgi:hypothetical protein
MDWAITKFLLEVGDTRAANSVVSKLRDASAAQKYGIDNRNEAVESLAVDVEAEIGAPASMIFRFPGPLHNSLQELMDEFWDFVDGKGEQAV